MLYIVLVLLYWLSKTHVIRKLVIALYNMDTFTIDLGNVMGMLIICYIRVCVIIMVYTSFVGCKNLKYDLKKIFIYMVMNH